MLDTLEKVTIQDFIFAEVFGLEEGKVEEHSLYQMKNEMHNKAFKMRYNNETISQEEADMLNKRLDSIINKLMKYDYDIMCDYIIDFDSFVKYNENYNKFCW